jgi:hypothetical protein
MPNSTRGLLRPEGKAAFIGSRYVGGTFGIFGQTILRRTSHIQGVSSKLRVPSSHHQFSFKFPVSSFALMSNASTTRATLNSKLSFKRMPQHDSLRAISAG